MRIWSALSTEWSGNCGCEPIFIGGFELSRTQNLSSSERGHYMDEPINYSAVHDSLC